VRFLETDLKDVILVEPDVHQDQRGHFLELYHAQKFTDGGITCCFLQDNYSKSIRGTLRGLHYQLKNPQGKLIVVVEGTIFDVALDIRRGSPSFGKWYGIELSAENKRQLYIPPGFAHGFCVLSTQAGVVYKCTNFYSPEDERGIIWNDRTIGITWPLQNPLVSLKDQSYQSLADSKSELPFYGTAP
jgi:dTDP-4-dehydrorhamnose 3,5-epimerase